MPIRTVSAPTCPCWFPVLRSGCRASAERSSPQPLPPIATTPAQTQTPSEQAIFISSLVRRVEFLTADGFAPYTGRSLEAGGMLTQVIAAAMGVVKEEAKGRFDYGVSWVNDWSAHLNPLLLTRAFDVGFPWARPNCDAVNLEPTSQFRCQRFFFSEPLYEGITGLFVRSKLADQVAAQRRDCRCDAVHSAPVSRSMSSTTTDGTG